MTREKVIHAQGKHRVSHAPRKEGSTIVLRFIIRNIEAHAKSEVDFGGAFIFEVIFGMSCE